MQTGDSRLENQVPFFKTNFMSFIELRLMNMPPKLMESKLIFGPKFTFPAMSTAIVTSLEGC